MLNIINMLEREFGIVRVPGAAKANFSNGLQVGGSDTDLSATELEKLDGITNGTISANKALVADANGLVKGVRTLLGSNTADASFGGSGANVEQVVSSIAIPAGAIYAGAVTDFKLALEVPTTISTDTLRIRLRYDGLTGTVLFDSTALDVVDDDYVEMSGQIVWRTAHASTGTGMLNFLSNSDLGGSGAIATTARTALSSLDTVGAASLDLTAVWSTENANSMVVKNFTAWHS